MCKSKAEGGQRCYGHTANAAMTSWAAASTKVRGQTKAQSGAAANAAFKRLQDEGKKLGVADPSRKDVEEFLDRQEARVRASDLSDARKGAILTRLQQTREIDRTPDGATWHAWQNVEGETGRSNNAGADGYRQEAREKARERTREHVEKLQELHQQLLDNPEKMAAFVESRSKFRRYSMNNQMLIQAQMPQASLCASEATWKELGREVKEDQRGKGPMIQIPLTSKRVEVDEETGEEEEKSYTRFGVGSVYDVSQTTGKPLPSIVSPVAQDAPKAMTERLDTVAQDAEITVRHADLGSADSGAPLGGYYTPSEREVTINSQMPAGHQAKTYAHELGHAFDPGLNQDGMTEDERRAAYTHGRADAEAVAETAAFVFSRNYNHDTSDYSGGYIQSWCGKDTTKLASLLPRIDAVMDKLMPEDPTDALMRDASKKARAKSSARRAERKKKTAA